jgi:predicted amidohydrolase
MSMHFRAAAVQFEPRQFAKEENISRLLDLVREAAENGARLIVTPEMGTTGYCWFDRDEVRPYVEPVPGPTTERFQAIAAQHACYIVIGMPEVDPATDVFYNSAVLIGPDGVVGRHRKSHPYIAEPKWAASGDVGHQVFETPIGRIALLICMDIHFLETARLVGLQHADVICHISNWLAERTPAPYWISRAFENGCYLIESNRWGLERTVQFSGGSCIIAPDGSIQAVIDTGDGIIYGTIDRALVREHQEAGNTPLAQRKPQHYKTLLSHPFTWNPLDYFGLYGHAKPPTGKRSHVAVAQFMPSADPDQNLRRIAEMAQATAADGLDLLITPELSLTGPYAVGREQALDGLVVERLMALAARLRIYIVAGLAEREGRDLFNTAVLTGPEGLVGSYRKIHLDASDRLWAQAGTQWRWFDIPAGRVGLMIGQDALFPESGRCLAVEGCEIIACPSAISGVFTGAHGGTSIRQNYPIPTGADPHHWHHFRVRAGENNVYFAFANWLDAEKGYLGKSGVFGPDTFSFPRRESAVLTEEGVAVALVDTSNGDPVYPVNVVKRKDIMCMRMPHHYMPLVSTPAN